MKLNEVDTPALIVDLELVEKNIRTMKEFISSKNCKLRAHTKIHKSPYFAQLQLRGGSTGITCAKLGEAEIMAQSGISDILLANEIIGGFKTQRLANLSKYCNLIVAVDDLENAKQISSAVSELGSTISMVVDVNLSGGSPAGDSRLEGILDRCGVPPGKPVEQLAIEVVKLPNVKLRGVMGYEGGLPDPIEIDKSNSITRTAFERLVESAELIRAAGHEVDIVSCGSSTSYKVAASVRGITEIQAGSYILMDVYHHNFSPEFDYALWVTAQVISLPKPDKAILDAGGNAISGDAGLPEVGHRSGVKVTGLNAEHIHVETDSSTRLWRGDKIDLFPSNIDTTTCLHDNYFVSSRGEIEMILPVAARGKFQ